MHQNKTTEAITLLEPIRKHELSNTIAPSTYITMRVRGLAYLQLKDGTKAAAEFQKSLHHLGINSLSPLLPLSRRPRRPHPERSQIRVREVAVIL
jgi:hypothetical protein